MEIFHLLSVLVEYYTYMLIFEAALSWLLVFDIVKARNPIVRKIRDFCHALSEPICGPIRPYTTIGGIDLSMVVVVVLLTVFMRSLREFIIYSMY